MGFFDRLFRRYTQPDLTFAADGFSPIAIMRANGIDVDLHAHAEAYALSLIKDGCTVAQANSAWWGGVSATTQDLGLFNAYVSDFDATMQEAGMADVNSLSATKAKYRAAATLLLGQVMSEAPNEYERFLKYVRA